MTTDYSDAFQNCAIYLPSINEKYAPFPIKGRFSRDLPFTPKDLDFLTPGGELFHYPWALYSAGRALSERGDTMVSLRDRANTVVLGDSGGFQIQQNTIKFQGADTTRALMHWMEANTDWSMVLDFPTGGISTGKMARHTSRLEREGHDLNGMARANGLGRDFNACLRQTLVNNDQFMAERKPGATRFLNVLQGRNDAESSAWFQAVRHYSTPGHSAFEGWAFAGGHCRNLSLMMRRLIEMRDLGLLRHANWIHILGVSQLDLACLYTVIQRCLRETVNPCIQVSYDSATPFITAGKFHVCSGATFGLDGWSIRFNKLVDDKYIGSQETLFDYLSGLGKPGQLPPDTQIADRIRLGDLCVARGNSGSWAGESVFLAANHNVEAVIDAIRTAHQIFFFTPPEAYGFYGKPPVRAVAQRHMIELIFKDERPMSLIDQHEDTLNGETYWIDDTRWAEEWPR